MSEKQEEKLLAILCKINQKEEMSALLELLFTDKEHSEIINRLKILDLLIKKIPQREISKRLGVGIATVTRGAQALNNDYRDIFKNHIK